YFPVPPQDSAQDMRGEMLAAMASMGATVEKHHHEVASAQHELGLKFGPLTTMADNMQIYKYCIHMVAQSYGKTATFMPKPIYGDNGSGYAPTWSPGPTESPRPSCQSRSTATTARVCTSTSRSGRAASR